jgi:hypothetical protein
MNIAVFVLTGAVTALGVGYFCVDLYRNRNQRLSHFEPIADITGVEFSPNVVHAEGELSHNIGDGLGECVEAIAHTLSHH